MQHCLYENVLLCTIHHLLIFTNVRLFVRDRVISDPPSPVDTNATLFERERVIACRSSPIDTNVRLFVRKHVFAYSSSPNECQLIVRLLILWCDGKHYINTCMYKILLNHILRL